jgi:hypothetical protein
MADPLTICPLSLTVMRDPVTDNEGNTFDRKNIVKWLRAGHTTSPISRQPLSEWDLRPSLIARALIGADTLRLDKHPFARCTGMPPWLRYNEDEADECSDLTEDPKRVFHVLNASRLRDPESCAYTKQYIMRNLDVYYGDNEIVVTVWSDTTRLNTWSVETDPHQEEPDPADTDRLVALILEELPTYE